jgi:PAS domain S-box-containing protein
VSAPNGGLLDYRRLFQKAPGLFVILNESFSILDVSDAFCRMAGISRDDVLNRNVFAFYAQGHDRNAVRDLDLLRVSLERTVQNRRGDAMPIRTFDFLGKSQDAAARHWSIMNSTILDEDGSLACIIHRLRDVTEAVVTGRKGDGAALRDDAQSIIARLRAANEELASLDTLRRGMLQMSRLHTVAVMASSIAHDLAQPLAAAHNFASALRIAAPFEAEATERGNEILTALDAQILRASHIVTGLRQYVLTGALERKLEPVADVLAEALRLARDSIAAAEAEITLTVAQPLLRVPMNRVQIQQVLVNLLTNAADALLDAPQRSITVTAAQEGQVVRVAVADTGDGIRADIRDKLFSPLTTTKASGMGLGLTICRQIVEAHGGTLTCTENQPNGTTFAFTLPMEPSAGAA